MQMKIIFLGTSSSVPTLNRGLTSLAIQRGGEIILFDAGEGTQRALLASKLGLNRRMKVLVTHLHGDHCVGLLGLLQSMSMVGRNKPLEVYGPRGLATFVKNNIRSLRFGLTFPIDLHTVKEGLVVREYDYSIWACRAKHNIPSFAYRLEEYDRPGVFHPEEARRLGIPEGRLWSLLQHGQRIEFGGKTITPDQVLGPARPGRKIGFSGDTRPFKHLERFFSGCDVLIFDSTYGDDHADKAVENSHSTAREAAVLAKRARVKMLVLTHFSARYDEPGELVAQASEVHPNVVAARDLMSLEVPYPQGSA